MRMLMVTFMVGPGSPGSVLHQCLIYCGARVHNHLHDSTCMTAAAMQHHLVLLLKIQTVLHSMTQPDVVCGPSCFLLQPLLITAVIKARCDGCQYEKLQLVFERLAA